MYYGFEVLWIREAWPVITQTAQRKQEWERVGDVPDKRHQEGQRLCLHPAIPSTSLSASCHHSIIVQMNVKSHVRVTSSSCWSLVCNTDHALWTDLGTSTFTFLSIIGTFFFLHKDSMLNGSLFCLQTSFTHLKARYNNKFNSIPTQLQIVSSGYFNSRHAILFQNLRQLWCFLLMLYIEKKRRRACV